MSYANDMPTADLRTDAGLASELRAGVMRLRRRLANERHPDNDLSIPQMVVLGLPRAASASRPSASWPAPSASSRRR